MSKHGSTALDRLFDVSENSDAQFNKNKSSYTFDEQLASANDDDDDLLSMMSEQSKKAFLSRIMPEDAVTDDEQTVNIIEPITSEYGVEEEASAETDINDDVVEEHAEEETTGEIASDEQTEQVTEQSVPVENMEETDIIIERPAERPITDDEQLNNADDVNEEIVKKPAKPKRGRRARAQRTQEEQLPKTVEKENCMEQQNVTNSILDVLVNDLVESLLSDNYTFHGFSEEDTKLIINRMKEKLQRR